MLREREGVMSLDSWTQRTLRAGALELIATVPEDPDELTRTAEASGATDLAYWAHVWPTVEFMVRWIAETPLLKQREPPMRVLELGCGLGLAGIAAAMRGADVVLTDVNNDALTAATRNALLNSVTVQVQHLDWTEPPSIAGGFDLILGSDVLYAPDAHGPIGRLIRQAGCAAVLGDPNRTAADAAPDVFRDLGLSVWTTPVRGGRLMLVQ
jgi:predicted nicotinamide N-methyase